MTSTLDSYSLIVTSFNKFVIHIYLFILTYILNYISEDQVSKDSALDLKHPLTLRKKKTKLLNRPMLVCWSLGWF